MGGSADHAEKERWADYAVLLDITKITFDSAGKIATFWGMPVNHSDSTYRAMNLSGIDAEIIQKAQRVARKNRINLDTGTSPLTFNDVQTVDAIINLVTGLENDITNNNDWGIKSMNTDEYIRLSTKANDRGWSGDEVITKYKEAKASFTKALSIF